MIRLENIKIRENLSEESVVKNACEKYHISWKQVEKYQIIKKSIDARKKEDIFYLYTVDIQCKDENKIKGKRIKKIKECSDIISIQVKRDTNIRPVIVGMGPSGIFCAMLLVQYGIKPIILEQGKPVEERIKDVEKFRRKGILNEFSNVQFGEGGAGTFSDGKLTTGLHNQWCKKVLEEFVKFGAPKQILYMNKPHIGTDNLVKILVKMREYVIKNGADVLFDNKVTDIKVNKNKLVSIKAEKEIFTDTAVFAIGHSARDTFQMLYNNGMEIQPKNFSVGVRIEHKQEMINKSQYGTRCKLALPPAEYKLVYHGKERTCYTFCMCPGGEVMASSSEKNTIVTNGMSRFARDGENANSAVLVEVMPSDFRGESPFEGMYFQKKLEEKAFQIGGNNYYAPIQRVEDFIQNKKTTKIGEIIPTYYPGVTFSNLNDIFPEFISETLKEGIQYFDTKLQGFAMPDAILTGVETRSSSPIQIKRNNIFMSNIKGIYPCGEGAGYAGGIMSAAIDGMKCAKAILENE